jgi:hypothetical protein
MGLDMHLLRKDNSEIGYWRKANAIHGWFVRECQGGIDECQRTRVTKAKLRSLIVTVNDILGMFDGGLDWMTLAKKTLPSQSGFFFGGTEYNEYYLLQLRQTMDILKKALNESGAIYYQSSW